MQVMQMRNHTGGAADVGEGVLGMQKEVVQGMQSEVVQRVHSLRLQRM